MTDLKRTGSDDGFGLACKQCAHLFPLDITVGVLAAHMEAEHGITVDTIEVELVVLCPRCGKAMALERSEPIAEGEHHHYACAPCHRGRAITQRGRP